MIIIKGAESAPFFMCAEHVQQLEGASPPYRPGRWNCYPDGKGVRREVEFEGSRSPPYGELRYSSLLMKIKDGIIEVRLGAYMTAGKEVINQNDNGNRRIRNRYIRWCERKAG